jgi:hypothetical protein
MTLSKNTTLCIRPSLAFPERWSVDYWLNGHPKAAYQASLLTFGSPEESRKTASQIKASWEARGKTLHLSDENKNVSRDTIPSPRETEGEIKKHLENYVEKAFEPMRKFSFASFFDVTKWVKGIKAIGPKSPHLLSFLILGALFFRGPLERLLAAVVPSELGLKAPQLLAGAPILILASTLFAHFQRTRASSQLNRIREWILQLTVFCGWDRDRFLVLMGKEFEKLEYASTVDLISSVVKRDPSSFTNLARDLVSTPEGSRSQETGQLMRDLLRDDFARKIQALAGLAGEQDYRPTELGIFPFHLLLSLLSVKTIMLGLREAEPAAGVDFSQRFNEGAILLGMILGLVLGLAIIVPTLVWTTALSLTVSPLLFTLDLVASLVTLSLLTRRPLAVVFRRRFIPRGLNLYECGGALNVL